MNFYYHNLEKKSCLTHFTQHMTRLTYLTHERHIKRRNDATALILSKYFANTKI